MSEHNDQLVLKAHDIYKGFHQGSQTITVLQGVQLNVARGERVAILGRSGSGKSTLMHVLAGLDTPDRGEVHIAGVSMQALSADHKAAVRAQHMGFVYQNHHLLAEFSAQENVAMPLRLAGCGKGEAMQTAAQMLAQVGLEQRLTHIPAKLSGGERQRVAVARAMVSKPAVVLADEPTGNLDHDNAQQVMQLIQTLSEKHQVAFVVVTHDSGAMGFFDRALLLENGQLREYQKHTDG